nr:MAG TPA: hypothetical protein [Caudoviricetes sp.]
MLQIIFQKQQQIHPKRLRNYPNHFLIRLTGLNVYLRQWNASLTI